MSSQFQPLFPIGSVPPNEEEILVLYHDDLDGYASWFGVHQFIRRSYWYISQPNTPGDKIFYQHSAVQYGDSAEKAYQRILDNINDIKLVIIVDFSLDQKKLDELRKYVRVVVVDHHKSSCEKLSPHQDTFIDISTSGCELTWRVFNAPLAVPYCVQMAGDFDTWSFKLTETKAFAAGMPLFQDSKTPAFWNKLHSTNLSHEVVSVGAAILLENQRKIDRFIKAKKYALVNFDGYKVAFFNQVSEKPYTDELHSQLNDQAFGDFTMAFFITNESDVVFNLRSKGAMDVSKVAMVYGGGGHKNAASFRLPIRAGLQLVQDLYSSV